VATELKHFVGRHQIDRAHSSVQFAVSHIVSTFRASFEDVEGELTIRHGAAELTASARVESLTISDPPEFRDHVVYGADFFDANTHPILGFRSTNLTFNGPSNLVLEGDLSIRGVSRPVMAIGSYRQPTLDPFGSRRSALSLQTIIDRRDWGLGWQLPLPDRGEVLGWFVDLTVELELVQGDPE
jgi:polyisoprenoid-binding protein YceI